MNYELIGNEVDNILSDVHDVYLSQGRPTKKGGLRFLDWYSNKTFAFEKTGSTKDNNLLVMSAPYNEENTEKIESKLKKGPHGKEFYELKLRSSKDKGKAGKKFIEIFYIIPSTELIQDSKIENYLKKNTNLKTATEAVKHMLREYVEPMAKKCMDNFVEVMKVN